MDVYELLKRWNIDRFRVVDEQALREITLGASILATGGGGDPEIGFLWALNVLESGRPIVLIDPLDFPETATAAIAGCLGAPIVLTEKPPNGGEILW